MPASTQTNWCARILLCVFLIIRASCAPHARLRWNCVRTALELRWNWTQTNFFPFLLIPTFSFSVYWGQRKQASLANKRNSFASKEFLSFPSSESKGKKRKERERETSCACNIGEIGDKNVPIALSNTAMSSTLPLVISSNGVLLFLVLCTLGVLVSL